MITVIDMKDEKRNLEMLQERVRQLNHAIHTQVCMHMDISERMYTDGCFASENEGERDVMREWEITTQHTIELLKEIKLDCADALLDITIE